MKVNLAAPTENGLIEFTTAIIRLAFSDYEAKRKLYDRTGTEICDMFATGWKDPHRRMAKNLYGQIWWTIAARETELQTLAMKR